MFISIECLVHYLIGSIIMQICLYRHIVEMTKEFREKIFLRIGKKMNVSVSYISIDENLFRFDLIDHDGNSVVQVRVHLTQVPRDRSCLAA